MKRILQTLMGICQAIVLVAALSFGGIANANEGGHPLDKAPDRVSKTHPCKMAQKSLLIIA
jgi:ubiquinol-cytochrome c reductase cytochrome c1 subunit